MRQDIGWLGSELMGEDESRHAHAHHLGVPFVTLGQDDIDPEALQLLPEPLCRTHHIAAYAIKGHKLEVALLNLKDLEALEPLRSQLPYQIVPRLTTRESMRRALLTYQKLLKERFGGRLSRETHPQKALEALLRHALLMHAPEVHIETTARGVMVRYRHGKELREAMLLPEESRHLIAHIRSLANIGSKTLPQEGRMQVDLGAGESVAARVSSVPLLGGEKLVLRLIPEHVSSKGYTLEGLGLHGSAAATVRTALNAREGLVLVAGLPQSGRTTLMYTMLDLLNDPKLSLASVEERVAVRLPYVAQTQTNPTGGLSSAAALRAVLKQDPDVVAIDSIADRDTAELALSAAARGVFVIATIEAPTVRAAVEKLRALGIGNDDLARISVGIGTAVVRKLCDKQTRSSHKLERRHLAHLEERADFAAVLATLKDEDRIAKDVVWKDVAYPTVTGCSECEHGYKGYTGVYEVLPAVGSASLLLLEDALFAAAAGLTSVAEVLKLAEKYEPYL